MLSWTTHLLPPKESEHVPAKTGPISKGLSSSNHWCSGDVIVFFSFGGVGVVAVPLHKHFNYIGFTGGFGGDNFHFGSGHRRSALICIDPNATTQLFKMNQGIGSTSTPIPTWGPYGKSLYKAIYSGYLWLIIPLNKSTSTLLCITSQWVSKRYLTSTSPGTRLTSWRNEAWIPRQEICNLVQAWVFVAALLYHFEPKTLGSYNQNRTR